MTNQHQPIRVRGSERRRSGSAMRRLGKALIALAQAQAEADAQRQIERANGTRADREPGQRANGQRKPIGSGGKSGDAA